MLSVQFYKNLNLDFPFLGSNTCSVLWRMLRFFFVLLFWRTLILLCVMSLSIGTSYYSYPPKKLSCRYFPCFNVVSFHFQNWVNLSSVRLRYSPASSLFFSASSLNFTSNCSLLHSTLYLSHSSILLLHS